MLKIISYIGNHYTDVGGNDENNISNQVRNEEEEKSVFRKIENGSEL